MLADFDVRLRNTVKNEEYLLGFSREQYKQEVGKIKDFLSESVIRKEEPMPDDLFVMDFAISVPEIRMKRSRIFRSNALILYTAWRSVNPSREMRGVCIISLIRSQSKRAN